MSCVGELDSTAEKLPLAVSLNCNPEGYRDSAGFSIGQVDRSHRRIDFRSWKLQGLQKSETLHSAMTFCGLWGLFR